MKILKDVAVSEVLEGARPPSHCKFCCHDDDDEEENLKTAVDRQGRIITCVNMRKTGKVLFLWNFNHLRLCFSNMAHIWPFVFCWIFPYILIQ